MPSLSSPPSNLWETVKSDFKGLFPEDVFNLWFEPIVCLEAAEDHLILGVPNDFAAIWISDNYLDLITQRLRLNTGRAVTVKLKKIDHSPSQSPFLKEGDAAGASARAKTVQPVRRTVRVRLPIRLPRPMKPDDVDALLASMTTIRDLALFLLMLDGGLRPGEVLCLQLDDVSYGRAA